MIEALVEPMIEPVPQPVPEPERALKVGDSAMIETDA